MSGFVSRDANLYIYRCMRMLTVGHSSLLTCSSCCLCWAGSLNGCNVGGLEVSWVFAWTDCMYDMGDAMQGKLVNSPKQRQHDMCAYVQSQGKT